MEVEEEEPWQLLDVDCWSGRKMMGGSLSTCACGIVMLIERVVQGAEMLWKSLE